MLSANGILSGPNTIKLAPGIGGLTFANSVTYNKLRQQSAKSPNGIGSPITSNNGTIVLKRDRDSSPLHNMATLNNGNSFLHHHHHHHQQQQLQKNNHNHHHHQVTTTKILPRNVIPNSIASSQSPLMQIGGSSSIGSPSSLSTSSNGSNNGGTGFSLSVVSALTPITVKPALTTEQVVVESKFPKPAYSYSCLIALALKNSQSGSLPVSEIYSFMCEHFPYFKTAHSGWKNSVRHNLSLRKCFEKVTKKGFLWAMNPAGIVKMDEEIQKWSRKDPMGIRNAMVFPEHQGMLERGEIKDGSTGESYVEVGSQSEIGQINDSEQDQELDETIVEVDDIEEMSSKPQHHKDFEILGEYNYDTIDIRDDFHMAITQNDIVEANPITSNDAVRATVAEYHSLTPLINIQNKSMQQKQHVQNFHHRQNLMQQQQQFQQITTLSTTIGSAHRKAPNTYQDTGPKIVNTTTGLRLDHLDPLPNLELLQQQQQQITTIPHHKRRKTKLVNRIA